MDAEPSHVERLVSRYAKGRSVREIERQKELTEGALGNFIKRSRGRGLVQLRVMQRFVEALDAPMSEVSEAFVRDAGLGGFDYTEDELDLVKRYRNLCGRDRQRLRGVLAVFESIPDAGGVDEVD